MRCGLNRDFYHDPNTPCRGIADSSVARRPGRPAGDARAKWTESNRMTRTPKIPDSGAAAPAIAPTAESIPLLLDVDAVIAAVAAETGPVVAAMSWAEQEIASAINRHRDQGDVLYHTFGLLLPRDIGPGMGTEFVYRGHARELLQRAAAGADLRPATAAEICLALVQTSLQAPMHGPAAGLYLRMWLAAFPDHPLTAEHADHQVHYEHLHGRRLDELETTLRRTISDPDRQLGHIACAGCHHGANVACSLARR
jgi:hypothetical protein